ncbi:MAG: hypothetical protein JRJ46_04760 [Deltaproteobacteria bacterium]|nr:hypothetical protein [Deltaproteobacteria bacterium]
MEMLFESFMEIPLDYVRLQGLIQLVFVSGILIFKLMIPNPNKIKSE